uniref:Uncharacterized protein n=1 Tax=Hyaloperonospora arabidopsidis (strain Emoy2) TaxID=559515 RepID=M4C575_HYAAE
MTSQDSTQEESEIACDSGRFALWVQDLGTYTSSSGKTIEMMQSNDGKFSEGGVIEATVMWNNMT